MSDRAIIESIRKMAGTDKNDLCHYVNAEVLSVDMDSRTCECKAIDGHTDYNLTNVKLSATVGDGLVIEPTIGSTVVVVFSDNVQSFVAQFSDIEKITIFANTKVQLGDGSFGGLVKADELKTQLDTLKLTVGTIGTALTTLTGVVYANTANFSNIKNTHITHGQ